MISIADHEQLTSDVKIGLTRTRETVEQGKKFVFKVFDWQGTQFVKPKVEEYKE